MTEEKSIRATLTDSLCAAQDRRLKASATKADAERAVLAAAKAWRREAITGRPADAMLLALGTALDALNEAEGEAVCAMEAEHDASNDLSAWEAEQGW